MSALSVIATSSAEQENISDVSSDIVMDVCGLLNAAPVAILKKILRQAGMVLKGNKQDLIDRIVYSVLTLFLKQKTKALIENGQATTMDKMTDYQRLTQLIFAIDSHLATTNVAYRLHNKYLSMQHRTKRALEVEMDGYYALKFQLMGPITFQKPTLIIPNFVDVLFDISAQTAMGIPLVQQHSLYLWCYPESSTTRIHSWPLNTSIQINGMPISIKQRKQTFFNGEECIKGFSEPLNVMQAVRDQCVPMGRNGYRVTVTSRDSEKHLFFLQYSTKKSLVDIKKEITTQQLLPYEAAVSQVKKSFLCEGFDDEDDDVVASSTRISSRCPIGLLPIEIPCRGKFCNHLQCFDLQTFLTMNEKCGVARFRCGVCSNLVPLNHLIVDSFFLDIIQKIELGFKSSTSLSAESPQIVGGGGGGSASASSSSEMELEEWEVEIEPSAVWTLVDQSAIQASPNKPRKERASQNRVVEDLDTSSSSSSSASLTIPNVLGNTAHPPPAAVPFFIDDDGGGSGGGGECIDLTLSDSEDEEPTTKKSRL